MAGEELSSDGSSEAEHCHAAIHLFNEAQRAGVPRAPGGESLAEGFEGFVLVGVLGHGRDSESQEPMRLRQDQARLHHPIGIS
jgi:hypothetical protein